MKTMEDYIIRLREVKERASLGGGQEKVDKLHKLGKSTARERIESLLDPGSFAELDMLVGYRLGSPGDAIITGHGTIEGRIVCIFAQDSTIFGGSIGYLHGRKLYKIHELALEMGVPVIGLNDSSGARVVRFDKPGAANDPFRASDEKNGGALFFINTRCSGAIPQISAVLGNCTGATVYSPALTDFIVMTEKTGNMFITGPRVIKSVTGEDISMDDLGGAKVHNQISGVADARVKDETECRHWIKKLLSYLPSNWRESPPVVETVDDPDRFTDALAEIVPVESNKIFDIRHVIKEIVDQGDFFEIKSEFAGEMVVGFARLEGRTIGIVANQPLVRAGCMSMDSSDKQARFIRFCDAFNIPIIMLVDTPGYLPGKEQEHSGIIRHGAKVLYALSEATVPRVAITLRKCYGGATLGMGILPGFGTDFVFAWPIAEFGPMGAEQAVALIYAKDIKEADNPEELKTKRVKEYRGAYGDILATASQCTAMQDVIEPRDTRRCLVKSLRLLRGKKVLTIPKKHGNIPL